MLLFQDNQSKNKYLQFLVFDMQKKKKKNDIYIKATPSCTDLWSTVLLWKVDMCNTL